MMGSSTLSQSKARLPLMLVMGIAGLLFALGINPYVMPESTDDIIYYEGARSLVHDGTYKFNGEIISDWPPVFSVILAGFFLVFGESLLLAKTLSAAFALLSIVLAARLLKLERRDNLWLTVAVYAFLPTGFLYAVRTSSDWAYITLCFAFLLILRRLADTKSIGVALLAGLTLGAAALTRHVGVMLGAAVIAQFIHLTLREVQTNKTSFLKAGLQHWHHVVTAVLGAGLWYSWSIFLKMAPEGTVAHGLYEAHGSSLMSNFQPGVFFFESVGDYFAQLPNIFEKLHLRGGFFELATSAFIGLILFIGLCRSLFKKGEFRATDYYVIAYSILLIIYEWKLPRFLLPIGPWLILYFFDGLDWISRKIVPKTFSVPVLKWQPRVLASLWIVAAIALNSSLIFMGHPGKLHGPLLTTLSPAEEEFYGPFYNDLLETGRLLKNLPPDLNIGTQGFYVNYLSTYGERPFTDPRLYPNRALDVIVDINSVYQKHPAPADWKLVRKTDNLLVYVKPDLPWELYNPAF